MPTTVNLRAIAALRPLRGHHPVVIACLDDPSPYEQRAEELEGLDAKLIVEREPGELSERLGRPSVTVADRYLTIATHEADADPDDVVKTVRWLEIRCEECPQSGVDMAPNAAPPGDWL